MLDLQQNSTQRSLENGLIYFYYLPKEAPVINTTTIEAKNLNHVQNFYVVLHPDNSTFYRLIRIGQKRLPEVEDMQETNWALIETVDQTGEALMRGLEEKGYIAKDHDEKLPAPLAAGGEGSYRLHLHNSHVHLHYSINRPYELKNLASLFHIKPNADYLISVKNPLHDPHLSHHFPALPENLKKEFNNNDLIPLKSLEFLNYPGIELLLSPVNF